jgi:hypothetical protein
MQTQLSKEEIAECGNSFYAGRIRAEVERPENIGKMVVIDVETGDYGVDTTGFETSHRLHALRPDAPLYAIRIGYRVSAALGGVMERTLP